MLNTSTTAKGNLLIELCDDSRDDLAEAIEKGYAETEQLMAELFHEVWTFINPEDIGALTDAPIICGADDTYVDDNGNRKFHEDARIFWYPDYAINNPWETLLHGGSVIFAAAPKN